jgi:hypothetical protein
MELMQENIALNHTRHSDVKVVDEAEQVDEDTTARLKLSAKTLDWDNPLPHWVTKSHPDIIMRVQLLSFRP